MGQSSSLIKTLRRYLTQRTRPQNLWRTTFSSNQKTNVIRITSCKRGTQKFHIRQELGFLETRSQEDMRKLFRLNLGMQNLENEAIWYNKYKVVIGTKVNWEEWEGKWDRPGAFGLLRRLASCGKHTSNWWRLLLTGQKPPRCYECALLAVTHACA